MKILTLYEKKIKLKISIFALFNCLKTAIHDGVTKVS